NYLVLRALQICDKQQGETLAKLYDDPDIDEEERVKQVMALYDAIGLKTKVEEAIADRFAQAADELDSIDADEALKAPLRELTATLVGRKK
ncbi:MAG: hypothetical protein IKS44_02240, partial [Bacteroidales bacterium]|nr:hypothetical protein [Bacteroidales bacterium]